MKLHEEFKEYETMWEAYAKYAPDTVRMWTAPDGTEVDIGSIQSRRTEVERCIASTDGDSKKSNAVFMQLLFINETMAELETIRTKYDNDNRRLINKLAKYTDIADKVDLQDLLAQLNAAKGDEVYAKTIAKLDKLNARIAELYNV